MSIKVSIITVVFNGERYLENCIQSVLSQNYPNIEYLIIDGGSTDHSLQIIEKYQAKISQFISEPDEGMYDAINKGIQLATGDVIGLLHADDFFADYEVISKIVQKFDDSDIEAVYGDLEYVNAKTLEIVRRWKSNQHKDRDFVCGWMPAHPTLYVRKELFAKYGDYSLLFGTAADYELILRFLFKNRIKAVYLPQLFVKMRTGGQSNATISSRVNAFYNDYAAARFNHLPMPLVAVVLKKLRKVKQYLKTI